MNFRIVALKDIPELNNILYSEYVYTVASNEENEYEKHRDSSDIPPFGILTTGMRIKKYNIFIPALNGKLTDYQIAHWYAIQSRTVKLKKIPIPFPFEEK
jgi:hypothetical protein